jgi:hypothetical protein
MIPAGYFERHDTPAKNSPVGKLMRKIYSRFPHLDLETIRTEARAPQAQPLPGEYPGRPRVAPLLSPLEN